MINLYNYNGTNSSRIYGELLVDERDFVPVDDEDNNLLQLEMWKVS